MPAFGNEWYAHWMYTDTEQKQRGNYYRYHAKTFGPPEKFGYKDLVPLFKAEKFNAARRRLRFDADVILGMHTVAVFDPDMHAARLSPLASSLKRRRSFSIQVSPTFLATSAM